jgi:hypothetical protein
MAAGKARPVVYGSQNRPFRLQVSAGAASGFGGVPAARGQCRWAEGCGRFEWANGRRFCREHWLAYHHQDRLPERTEGGC